MSNYLALNLSHLRKQKGDSQQAIADLLEVGRTAIVNYEKGTSAPDFDKLWKLVKYFDVNAHDLLFSDLKNEPQPEPQPEPQSQKKGYIEKNLVSTAKEPEAVYKTKQVQPIMVTVDNKSRETIVFVDVKAAAGYPENIGEPSFFKQLPAFNLPTRQFSDGVFRMFQVDGDSMDDTLKHGEMVIGRYLDGHAEACKNGYTYVIVTQDTVVFKRVLNRVKERGVLVLQSDNTAYRPYEVSITEIQEIWDIKAAVIFDLTNKRLDLLQKVNGLTADMVAVQADIKEMQRDFKKVLK